MQVVPHPKLKRDYRGRTVRTAREPTKGYVSIPDGCDRDRDRANAAWFHAVLPGLQLLHLEADHQPDCRERYRIC